MAGKITQYFSFLPKILTERDAIYPSQNIPKRLRNLNALAGIKSVYKIIFHDRHPTWGRGTCCGYNCLSLKHLRDIDVMTQHKTATEKTLGVLLCSEHCAVY